MRKHSCMRTRARGQEGYALLVVMFLLTLLVLMTITVAPNALTQAQREKETEMVWRGKQYVRGIKRYYMKMHRFPTDLEDLTKPKTGIRFMRQAYKDPMNGVDGSWRLIYVGPNGQLIGSLKNRNTGGPGIPASSLASTFGQTSSSFGSSSFGTSSFGNGSSFNSSMGSSGFGSNANNLAGQTASNTSGGNSDGSDATSGQESGAPVDTPVIIGGNIIGVGSKVNKKSFLWYDKAKNYREFEFVWDPAKDMMNAMGLPQQQPAPGAPIGAPGVPLPANVNPAQNSPTSPTNDVPLQAPPQN